MEEEKYERSAPQRREFPTRENFRNIFPCFIFVGKARQLEIRKGEVKKSSLKKEGELKEAVKNERGKSWKIWESPFFALPENINI